MVRTEWLNTSVDDLRSSLRNCEAKGLLRIRQDLLDTAAEAEARGLRTKHQLLLSKVRTPWICTMCSHVYISSSRIAPTRSCPHCGCRLENHWRAA